MTFTPTRHTALLKRRLEHSSESLGASMRAVGFSPATSKAPSKILKGKTWQKLLEKKLPDDLLTEVHLEGLKASRYENKFIGKGKSELVEVPDYTTRHKYMDTAYKLKNKFPKGEETGPASNVAIVINVPQNDNFEPLHVDAKELNT